MRVGLPAIEFAALRDLLEAGDPLGAAGIDSDHVDGACREHALELFERLIQLRYYARRYDVRVIVEILRGRGRNDFSGKTAQATLETGAGGTITYFSITSSNTGFISGEPLTLSGNTTGSGVGTLLAYIYNNQLDYVYIYGNDTGYTNGETGVLTGTQSGATAQVMLETYQNHILLCAPQHL